MKSTLNPEFEHSLDSLFAKIDKNYRANEENYVDSILPQATLEPTLFQTIQEKAKVLVKNVREQRLAQSGLDAFMFQYDLSSEEGVALMCLAEALLRIPDKETIDKLIRDKLSEGDWEAYLGKSQSLFVNAATWGLMLTGKIVSFENQKSNETTLSRVLKRLANKGGEPIIRQVVMRAMKILGRQFVMGRTIEGAVKRAKRKEAIGYRYSYDMLGESAFTAKDAEKYFLAYQHAIQVLAQHESHSPIHGPGISVKLSALCPRYVLTKKQKLKQELLPRLEALVIAARDANIGFTIDAEEAHTLTLSLELIQYILERDLLGEWEGFGLAVQAYQKRAPAVLDWLKSLLLKHQKRMMVRLVKGAYWDSEIKLAQVQGVSGYPVFTRKVSTDIQYMICAKKLLAATDVFYPQFATHNALTLATVRELARQAKVTEFEFQCLHGMGDALYDQIVASEIDKMSCRIYAPVGTHEELLAYLVRRLLENGANTSFVNRIIDETLPIEDMIQDPVQIWKKLKHKASPSIPLPKDLFLPERANSQGIDFSAPTEFIPILTAVEQAAKTPIEMGDVKRTSPIDSHHYLGTVHLANEKQVTQRLENATLAFQTWRDTLADDRALMLENMAELLQENQAIFLSLLIYEGGKTIDDALAELREAIDYCYYYAMQARKNFSQAQLLPGPTGERNQLSLTGRGVIACISPWNFPLAIFLGQVTAALAAGNCVIAKPASQTILVASKAVELLHQAGFPPQVVQLLPGSGAIVGNTLVNSLHIQGVLFTGSTQTARDMNQKLANRIGPIVPLIAETGGQNAMIVDSSALPEQVVQDVIVSAFRSAGQRCSALRVLFVQEDIADKIITMLSGAMAELKIGHPMALSTDVGPVIDDNAKKMLAAHVLKMDQEAKCLCRMTVPENCPPGSFFAPHLYEISSLDVLKEEVFGPILHVIRFKNNQLKEVIAQINNTGYGLTLGIHSRINQTIQTIYQQARVGNIYVNRNMIGAVVGSQPFGGEGLSGTGPKAGGPHYMLRLAIERTLSINTTASGGNTALMSLSEGE